MTPAPEPTFTANSATAATRVNDYIQVAFQPEVEADPVVWERVPLTTDLQGFVPNRTVVRKEAFADADGTARVLVAMINNGGSIQFNTASKAAIRNRLLAASEKGEPVLFKANYVSAAIQFWGSGKINDRGIQGGRNDIPDWGFTIEAEEAKMVDATGNLIG